MFLLTALFVRACALYFGIFNIQYFPPEKYMIDAKIYAMPWWT